MVGHFNRVVSPVVFQKNLDSRLEGTLVNLLISGILCPVERFPRWIGSYCSHNMKKAEALGSVFSSLPVMRMYLRLTSNFSSLCSQLTHALISSLSGDGGQFLLWRKHSILGD